MVTPSSETDTRSPRTQWRLPAVGRYWLIGSSMLLLVGWLKGLNLVLLLGNILIVIWTLNYLLAGRRLDRLWARRRLEGPVFARQSCTLRVEVTNPQPPARVGFWIEDRGPAHQASWFVAHLAPEQTLHFSRAITLPRRGRYRLAPLRAQSGYPFGLIERSVPLLPEEDPIVLPRLGRLHRGRLRRFLTWDGQLEERLKNAARPTPCAQPEFHGLRPFRSGDSLRSIHWRTSARRGELMVREHEHTATDDLVLVVEPWIPGAMPNLEAAAFPWITDPTYRLEEVISLAATICWEWCRQKGDRFALAVAGPEPVVLSGITGPAHALQMLECLAIQPGSADAPADLLAEQLRIGGLPPGPILLVTTRPGPLADELAARLHRPVVRLEAAALDAVDFYERPGPDGA